MEVQERDKVEFTLRNLELENTKLVNNLKQVCLLCNLAKNFFIGLLMFFDIVVVHYSIYLISLYLYEYYCMYMIY